MPVLRSQVAHRLAFGFSRVRSLTLSRGLLTGVWRVYGGDTGSEAEDACDKKRCALSRHGMTRFLLWLDALLVICLLFSSFSILSEGRRILRIPGERYIVAAVRKGPAKISLKA